ncbi:MAG TPA: prepilin-type N-terminal cleavage/methylation domain-containing protein [Candidatus Sulfotelmatobacter sp.]|nr:prepilin-type N-terminal cleavage/methylation domain-containing protein [Candidatus Sulfotelmatobacter sp.]
MKASTGAFTLIELLVVIAIIAILAAILLPVLQRAQARSKMIYDLNNFKQLQLCWHMYVLDNNDYLPPNFGNITSGALSNSWVVGNAQTDYTTANIEAGMLYQYNQNARIYQCPANTVTVTITGTPPPPYHHGQQVPQTRTCEIDFALGGNTSGGPGASPYTITYNGFPTFNSYQKFSQIPATQVAQKIVFVDVSQADLDEGAFGLFPLAPAYQNTANDWWNLPCNRHNNGSVFSFADGHCEYWKWHGSVVNSAANQQGASPGSPGESFTADSSDDLPRTEGGGAQYP